MFHFDTCHFCEALSTPNVIEHSSTDTIHADGFSVVLLKTNGEAAVGTPGPDRHDGYQHGGRIVHSALAMCNPTEVKQIKIVLQNQASAVSTDE
jgi:hypothetical protein